MAAISQRIRKILDLLPYNEPVWDLCCDHGLIGIGALKKGASYVFFNDQVAEIIAKLSSRLVELELSNWQSLVCAAEDISADINGTVVISGVGGHTLVRILDVQLGRASFGPHTLILSPMSHVGVLHEFIRNSRLASWTLEEYLVKEKHRERVILILRQPNC